MGSTKDKGVHFVVCHNFFKDHFSFFGMIAVFCLTVRTWNKVTVFSQYILCSL